MSKLRNTAAILGLTGVLTGCEVLNESPPPELMWLAGQGYHSTADDASSLQQARALHGLGSTLEFSAQSEANRQAAREGRSNVNVYTSGSNNAVSGGQESFRNIHPLRRPGDVIFVSSGYKGDLNNNGKKDYPDEFGNVGQDIVKGNDVFIYMRNSINRDYALVFEVLKEGQIVNRGSGKMNAVREGEDEFVHLRLRGTSNGAIGVHTVRCFVDGQYWGGTEFNLKSAIKVTLKKR